MCCRFELDEWLGDHVDHVCCRFELEEWLGGSCVL